MGRLIPAGTGFEGARKKTLVCEEPDEDLDDIELFGGAPEESPAA